VGTVVNAIRAARREAIGDGRWVVLRVSDRDRIRTEEVECKPSVQSRHVNNTKRCSFTIKADLLERLQAMKARTGLSAAEQIRQAIRWWLDSRQWPDRPSSKRESTRGR
jgi:hypothetical protein